MEYNFTSAPQHIVTIVLSHMNDKTSFYNLFVFIPVLKAIIMVQSHCSRHTSHLSELSVRDNELVFVVVNDIDEDNLPTSTRMRTQYLPAQMADDLTTVPGSKM